jgi:mono/diheme cytochrome c family protein
MKTIFVACVLATIALLGASSAHACPDCWWGNQSWEGERDWREGMPSMRRHHYVMNRGIPEAYRRLDNPLRATDSVLTDGQRIYEQNCASCHGESGRGDGPAAEVLSPQPANLRHLGHMSMMANDAYLFWTIADGGEPIDTDMPAFNESLSDDEIWSVILYLRREL